jgi:bilin biosynthesis protein
MNQRPFSIFSLTEDQAIALLATPPDQLDDPSDRYIAASQLVNYPSDRTIKALMAIIPQPAKDLHSRIVRRKAVETLGYLKATAALPLLQDCLEDEDPYTVQNAVWSIGEIGTPGQSTLTQIVTLLKQPEQNHRLIIQTLARLSHQAAVEEIRPFINAEDASVLGAAIAALYQLTGDTTDMLKIIGFLQHTSVNVRRSSIQDLIDAGQYHAIPNIAQCPVSMAFRLRGIRLLAEKGMGTGAILFPDLEPVLDQIIRDHPKDLELVHEYDQTPTLEFVIRELYETDFARCYLATQTLLDVYPDVAPAILMEEFHHKAHGDYGAHYHVLKLLGWLHHHPAYEILIEALHNPAPQFQKSRTAAAIALGELGDPRAISHLHTCLKSSVWGLNYACLIALNQLHGPTTPEITLATPDFLVEAKALKLYGKS